MIVLPIAATVVAFAMCWRSTKDALTRHERSSFFLSDGSYSLARFMINAVGAAAFILIVAAIWMVPQ